MRCVNCGFPVSPSRTTCPRCGAEVNKGNDGRAGVPQQAGWSPVASDQGSQGSWNTPGRQDGYPGQMNPSSFGASQQPFGGSAQPSYPPSMAPSGFQSANYGNGARSTMGGGPGRPPARSPRLALTVAGLCVFAGAIILILVFILTSALPPTSSNDQAQQKPTATSAPQQTATDATPTADPTEEETATPTATPTDTATYPASQYIDKAQMANSLDEKTAKVTQPGDKFKVGDKMYVAFALHPGKSGTVCLSWYINSAKFSDYEFDTDGTALPAYSYSITHATGPGYVEIYWANSKSCSDKQLAQKVKFTVS